jgi:hypothetical protein
MTLTGWMVNSPGIGRRKYDTFGTTDCKYYKNLPSPISQCLQMSRGRKFLWSKQDIMESLEMKKISFGEISVNWNLGDRHQFRRAVTQKDLSLTIIP